MNRINEGVVAGDWFALDVDISNRITFAITQPEKVDPTQVKTADRGLGVHRLVIAILGF